MKQQLGQYHPPNIILIFQTAAHGTDISTGNQTGGIPSLPAHVAAPPDTGSGAPVSSGGVGGPGQLHHQVNGGGYVAPHDRNHNTVPGAVLATSSGRPGECSRPGCGNSVSKSVDGTESTYCSSDCVVDQCRCGDTVSN